MKHIISPFLSGPIPTNKRDELFPHTKHLIPFVLHTGVKDVGVQYRVSCQMVVMQIETHAEHMPPPMHTLIPIKPPKQEAVCAQVLDSLQPSHLTPLSFWSDSTRHTYPSQGHRWDKVLAEPRSQQKILPLLLLPLSTFRVRSYVHGAEGCDRAE